MSFDRREFTKHAEREALSSRTSHRADLLLLKQAAIAVENATGSQGWDTFLSYLQAALQETAELRDRYMNDLANPQLVDPNVVAQKRIAVIRLNERIQVLGYVLQLPSQIAKHGEIAKEELKKLTVLEEETVA